MVMLSDVDLVKHSLLLPRAAQGVIHVFAHFVRDVLRQDREEHLVMRERREREIYRDIGEKERKGDKERDR